jgi:hypothetical protein
MRRHSAAALRRIGKKVQSESSGSLAEMLISLAPCASVVCISLSMPSKLASNSKVPNCKLFT